MVVLAALVVDRVGTLSRMTGLCHRRGYNVVSVTVSPTEERDVKRLTFALECEEDPDRLERQFLALADVLEVRVLMPEERVDRELMLAKVRLGPQGELPEAIRALGARVVWQQGDLAIAEATGPSGSLQPLVSGPPRPGVIEVVVTGHTSLDLSEGRMEIPPHEPVGHGTGHGPRARPAVRVASLPPLRLPEPRPQPPSEHEEALAE